MKTKDNYSFRNSIFLLLLLVFIPGCEKIEPGKPFDCRIGREYFLTDDISFTIQSLADSRCPREVICFWAGNVTLSFNIDYLNTKIDTTIYFMSGDNNPFRMGDYRWSILEVTPYPVTTDPIDQSDYRIRLLIDKE